MYNICVLYKNLAKNIYIFCFLNCIVIKISTCEKHYYRAIMNKSYHNMFRFMREFLITIMTNRVGKFKKVEANCNEVNLFFIPCFLREKKIARPIDTFRLSR